MNLIGHWFAEAIALAVAAALGLLAMQAPALTYDYSNALLQVAQSTEHDIAERQDSARRVYDLGAAPADQVMATLTAREPSNAETLARSIDRATILRAAYQRLQAAPDLLRPLVVALDTAEDGTSVKADILRTSLRSFTPALAFTTAALVYGLAGLIAGRLLAGLAFSMLRRNKHRLAR